jgi:hypothetical protein
MTVPPDGHPPFFRFAVLFVSEGDSYGVPEEFGVTRCLRRFSFALRGSHSKVYRNSTHYRHPPYPAARGCPCGVAVEPIPTAHGVEV